MYINKKPLSYICDQKGGKLASMERNRTCPKKHELKLNDNPNKKCYICNGCKEYGSNGMRYRCEDCNYDLHKDCMFSKPTTTHGIFKDFVFKFYEQPPPSKHVGNMSKVSSTIALKRTWICTLVVSTSWKNSKLIMWNFTFVRLSQSAYFAIKLTCRELRCGRMCLSVVSIMFMFLA